MALSLSHLTNKWYVVLLLYVVVVGSKKVHVCFWYMSARLLNSKVSSRLGDACLVFLLDEGGRVGELIASDPYKTGLYKLLQVYSLTHSIDRLINQSILTPKLWHLDSASHIPTPQATTRARRSRCIKMVMMPPPHSKNPPKSLLFRSCKTIAR